MASDTSVKPVSAVFVPAAGTGMTGSSVDSVEMHFEVNSIPWVDVSIHATEKGKVSVKEFSASLQLEEMAELQRYLFGEREGLSGVAITVGEGDGQERFSFTGIPLGPSKSAGLGSVSNRVKLIAPDVRLNAIRPYIYGPSVTDIANAEGELEGSAAPDGPNVMRRMLEILKKRMEFFTGGSNTNLSSFNSAATADMAKQIHAANQETLRYLENVVENSTEAIYESFNQLDARPEHEKRQIKGSINGILADKGLTADSNFFNTLLDVGAAFQMYFVPSMEGAVLGKFRPYRTMTSNDDNETKQVSIRNMVSSSGDTNYGPTQQVLVQGIFQMDVANVDSASKSESFVVPELQASTIYVWPNEASIVNGNFRIVGPPEWLPRGLEMFEDRKNIQEIKAAGGWDIEDYINTKDKIHALMETVMKDVYLGIIAEYAENVYCQVALSSFVLSAQTPLDLSWRVGKRYEVTDSEGTLLFKGFLQALTHKLSGLREALTAETYLSFSHVEYSSFTLPS